jgi:bifunctional non-homologous end joining protein LigD
LWKALKNRQKHFVIDGEAVILGVDGVSDFDALHSGKQNDGVQLCAFDILVEGDDDLRLHLRKTSLERLLARRPEGIFVNPFEQDRPGPVPRRVPDGARRAHVETPRPALSERPVQALA